MTTLRAVPIRRPVSKAANIAAWSLQVLLALAFFAAGSAKLAGAPAMVAAFTKIGFGQWFRLLTGSLEIIAAIFLLVPRLTFYAALLLVAIMTGALITHVALLGGNPAPAIVLLLVAATTAWLRRQ